MHQEKILTLKNITKRYAGIIALNDISIDFNSGEIHCLIGENGAGKSTLIKTITGAERPDSGQILFSGKTYDFLTPIKSKELGIAVVYQELSLVPDLSIAENIYLGHKVKKNGLIDKAFLNKKSKEVLESLNIEFDVERNVNSLSVSQMQIVEIARAIANRSKVLILDEPTASLTQKETNVFLEQILQLKKQGYTIIYITHKMEEILKIGDTYTVLRDGKKILDGKIIDACIEDIIEAMVGRTFNVNYPERKKLVGSTRFKVENLNTTKISDVSFDVKKGEILGIGGLVGSGRTEIIRAIFGLDKLISGKLMLDGKTIKINHPSDALKYNLGYIPEDRKIQGLLINESIKDNIVLANLKKISRKLILDLKKEEKVATEMQELLNIKTPNINNLSKTLSGGNQQKVVIAKWLATKSKILFMDEPTRGIDVGAKQEIYQLMNELTEQGVSIVMVSSEMEELLGMSDRILIMCEGKARGVFDKGELSKNKVMKLASGYKLMEV